MGGIESKKNRDKIVNSRAEIKPSYETYRISVVGSSHVGVKFNISLC